MRDDALAEFKALLTGIAAYYDRRLDPTTMMIYWRGLSDLPIEAVRGALNAHVQDPKAGQYMPKIADIRRAIDSSSDDGHPGPDEAWSIALPAGDESASVVWTEQIAAAFFDAAMSLLDAGDRIAARRAFIERYERELAEARKAGIHARWQATLGHDPAQRVRAVEQAVRAGRLTVDAQQLLLPPPDEPMSDQAVLMLENGMKETDPDKAQENIARLRALLRRAA